MAELRISVRGDLDFESAPRLQASLQEAITWHVAHVLLDCEGVTFIDSAGIGVILEAHNALEAQGRHLLVANVQPGPYCVFAILGLEDLLGYERTVSGLVGNESLNLATLR